MSWRVSGAGEDAGGSPFQRPHPNAGQAVTNCFAAEDQKQQARPAGVVAPKR